MKIFAMKKGEFSCENGVSLSATDNVIVKEKPSRIARSCAWRILFQYVDVLNLRTTYFAIFLSNHRHLHSPPRKKNTPAKTNTPLSAHLPPFATKETSMMPPFFFFLPL